MFVFWYMTDIGCCIGCSR